jgi:single-strand DNA-binding protein
MANFNRIILVGNLTRDPVLRYLPSQMAVVDFGLAVNHKYRTKTGEDREEVCFIDCTVFGKGAEVVNQYCQKGQQLLVEGRLKYDTWEDKQGGGKRSKHVVMVDNFQLMGGPDRGAGGGGQRAGGGGGGNAIPEYDPGDSAPQRSAPRPQQSRPPQQQRPPAEQPYGDEQQFKDEDIPF